MGKALSKAGMRLNTRRQRSQLIQSHQERLDYPGTLASGSAGVVPRVLEVDRTLLNLRLQKDELSTYKSRMQDVIDKEMEILKQLLLDGRRDSAQLLLKKKRFQEYLVDHSLTELDSILARHETSPSTYQTYKTEAEHCITRNSEALKRIQMILTLEDIERILDDGEEGQEKTQEVNKLLQLASVTERKKVEQGLDVELNRIFATLGVEDEEVIEKIELDAEDVQTNKVQDLIDLDDYVNEESREKSPEFFMSGSDSKLESNVDANQAQSTSSKIDAGRESSSSVLPDAPANSVADGVGSVDAINSENIEVAKPAKVA